jgi:hypothetical protein
MNFGRKTEMIEMFYCLSQSSKLLRLCSFRPNVCIAEAE